MLRDTTQASDPFDIMLGRQHGVGSAPTRVQNETLRHRGRKNDPLYSCRRRLVMTPERLGVEGHERLVGLLAAATTKARCGSPRTPRGRPPDLRPQRRHLGVDRVNEISATSPTPSCRPGWVRGGAPSVARGTRSSPGTGRQVSITPPKRPTTSSSASGGPSSASVGSSTTASDPCSAGAPHGQPPPSHLAEIRSIPKSHGDPLRTLSASS